MAHEIVFSTSDQAHNAGPGGYIEKFGMEAICNRLAKIFALDNRFIFKHTPHTFRDQVQDHVIFANNLSPRPELYIAMHSNAGQRGTEGFYFSSSVKGKRLAQLLVAALAPLSPGADTGGVTSHDAFIEIHGPIMTAVLIELEAHDWLAGVVWLTTKVTPIAVAIYKAVCKYYGLTPKVYPPATKPVPALDLAAPALKAALVAYAKAHKMPASLYTTVNVSTAVMGAAAKTLGRAIFK